MSGAEEPISGVLAPITESPPKIWSLPTPAVVLCLYLLSMLAFALFHPILEWPDAERHLIEACTGESSYPPVWLLDALGQDICSIPVLERANFAFFSDTPLYSDAHLINPGWAYIVMPAVCMLFMWAVILKLGNRDAAGDELIFAPPLAFYFANLNPEIFGLFIVVAAYFLLRRYPWAAIFLSLIAVFIDRSHICSFFTFLAIYLMGLTRRPALLWTFVGGVVILYAARLSGLLDIVDWLAELISSSSVVGLTGADIIFNANYGSRGYAALFASIAGLYGAMSYRPLLWPAYYLFFFSLLGIGYFRSSRDQRLFLILSLCAALTVLIVLPPLSQARYYPILIISMWSVMLRGGSWIGIPPLLLQLLFFMWTTASVLAADLSHIALG